VLFAVMRKANDRARASVLGLGPATNCFAEMVEQRWPTLYGFSPTVVPKPADWGPEVDVTGYWVLDREPGWRPPPALEAFLAGGPPPICVGFGSMPSPDPAALAREVVGALARAGQRGLLLSGWGALGDVELPETVFALESAPHDWLYPRVSAVVHHGGAGTTSAALRAGRPSMVVPFMADQWFWGERIRRLSAGPKWFPRRKLDAERFGAALRDLVENPRWREGAHHAANALAAEDGVARAIAALPF
jgi:UDP:flavonoid glycosyltransferase YjiC (YdhE family)